MPRISLYKNNTKSTSLVNYEMAYFDLENAAIDTDYRIAAGPTSTMVGDETIKSLRVDIYLDGFDYITGLDTDVNSPNNLVPPIKYVEDGATFNIEGSRAITRGEKPSDWDSGALYKYYTRYYNQDYHYYTYGGIQTDYSENIDYYEVPNVANIFYTTNKKGFFGVSRTYQLDTLNRQMEQVQVLYNGRLPMSSGSFFPTYVWKHGGAFGQSLYNIDYTNFSSYGYTFGFVNTGGWATYSSIYLVQFVQFKYEDEDYIGIMTVRIAGDGVPQEGRIAALSAKWFEYDAPANGGPISGRQGGHGSFSAPSDNRGDRFGQYVSGVVDQWNTTAAFTAANQNRYRMPMVTGTLIETAFLEVIENLWSPNLWEQYQNNFFNPKDAILVCHAMPNKLGPLSNNGSKKIMAAERDLSNQTVATFSDTYRWVHIDDKDISDYFDGFPDFDNTAVYIHLPYIGTKQLDIEAMMEGTIAVEYVSDVETGDVVAWVWTQDKFGNCNYRYEFKGNCARPVDLAYRSKTVAGGMAGSAVKAGAAIGVGLLTGSVFAGMTAATALNAYKGAAGTLQGAGAMLQNGLTEEMASSFQKGNDMGQSLSNSVMAGDAGTASVATNAHGGNVSAPVDTQCYLLITRSQWSNPAYYGQLFGFTSDLAGVIKNDFSGFLSVRAAYVGSIPATDTERAEIASLLQAGVYLNKPDFTIKREEE